MRHRILTATENAIVLTFILVLWGLTLGGIALLLQTVDWIYR